MTKQEQTRLLKVNILLKDVEEWRKNDAYRLNIIKWLIVKHYTECETVEDLTDLLDNCVVCPSNTEILNAENVDEFDDDTIKRYTGHTKKYIKNLDNRKGYLLHYPRIINRRCEIKSTYFALFFNLNDLTKKEKVKATRFVVFGALWFDSINGNTYNSAKIIDTKTKSVYYTRFCYGYGSQYLSASIDYIKERIYKKVDPIKDVFNGGYMLTNKKTAKEHLY